MRGACDFAAETDALSTLPYSLAAKLPGSGVGLGTCTLVVHERGVPVELSFADGAVVPVVAPPLLFEPVLSLQSSPRAYPRALF